MMTTGVFLPVCAPRSSAQSKQLLDAPACTGLRVKFLETSVLWQSEEKLLMFTLFNFCLYKDGGEDSLVIFMSELTLEIYFMFFKRLMAMYQTVSEPAARSWSTTCRAQNPAVSRNLPALELAQRSVAQLIRKEIDVAVFPFSLLTLYVSLFA